MDYTAHSTQARPNSGFVLGVVREHAAGREAPGVEEGLTSALLRIDRWQKLTAVSLVLLYHQWSKSLLFLWLLRVLNCLVTKTHWE